MPHCLLATSEHENWIALFSFFGVAILLSMSWEMAFLCMDLNTASPAASRFLSLNAWPSIVCIGAPFLPCLCCLV